MRLRSVIYGAWEACAAQLAGNCRGAMSGWSSLWYLSQQPTPSTFRHQPECSEEPSRSRMTRNSRIGTKCFRYAWSISASTRSRRVRDAAELPRGSVARRFVRVSCIIRSNFRHCNTSLPSPRLLQYLRDKQPLRTYTTPPLRSI